jgi:signal transduction histidine kinase
MSVGVAAPDMGRRTVPQVGEEVGGPSLDRRRSAWPVLGVAPLLGVVVVGTAALADHGRLGSSEWVHSGLLGAFTLAAWVLLRRDDTNRMGRIVLAGTALAALCFGAHAMSEVVEPHAMLTAVATGSAGLALGAMLHGLLALPDGVLGDRLRRAVVGAGYLVGAVVGAGRFLDRPEPATWPLVGVGLLFTVVGLGVTHRRYRSSRGVNRQRMQWLGAALTLVTQVALVVAALRLLLGWPGAAAEVVAGSFVLVPAALAVGASPRAVDKVERLLRHVVSAAGLSAVIVTIYVLVVVGLGRIPTEAERPILLLSMVAAAVSALLFLPARDRLAAVATRLVYDEPRDPTDALDSFGTRLTRALPMDELLLQLAELLRKHMSALRVEVWTGAAGQFARTVSLPDAGPGHLRMGEKEGRVVSRAGVSGRGWSAIWLPELVATVGAGPLRVVPMAHAGSVFGLLVVERALGDDDFAEDDDRVLAELARQVGLALHNTELDTALQASLDELRAKAAELQESRARIVAAADAQRRAIERDLHDGAQQHLVALAVKLRLIETLAQRDLKAAIQLLEEARADVQATVEEVRRLAHGIYPPLLMDKGLGEALRAVAARAPLPTVVEIDGGLARYAQPIEAAAYFCCLEALQNAGKHAGSTATATIRVHEVDGLLRFEVRDDGVGFDSSEGGAGHGFVNMSDRLGAIGGSLVVDSRPGGGTRVNGSIPIAAS